MGIYITGLIEGQPLARTYARLIQISGCKRQGAQCLVGFFSSYADAQEMAAVPRFSIHVALPWPETGEQIEDALYPALKSKLQERYGSLLLEDDLSDVKS